MEIINNRPIKFKAMIYEGRPKLYTTKEEALIAIRIQKLDWYHKNQSDVCLYQFKYRCRKIHSREPTEEELEAFLEKRKLKLKPSIS